MIVSEINFGEFDYQQRFPSSSRAKKTVTTVSVQTFSELCELWTSIKKTEISANTMRKTRSQLGTLMHIINGDTPVSAIRHSDILKYRKELLNGETLYMANPRSNKQGRTVRTVNNFISLLCSLLRFAYKYGFISGKPFEGFNKLHKVKVKPDPLTKQEFNLLAESERGQSLNMWTLAVYTGVRHGELAALAREDIDWEKGTAHIQRKLAALQPKTEIVFNHREYGAVEHQSLRFVFIPRMRKGEQKAYYSLSSIDARFNAAVKRAGIRRRNPYHTRHTFARWH